MAIQLSSSRRKFLATLSAGGAAAATVAIITRPGAKPESVAETATPQGKGYQLTEHVRNYYRTAKV